MGLEPSVRRIGDEIDFLRIIRFSCLFRKSAGGRRSGIAGLALLRTFPFLPQPGRPDNHLNRVHFEIVLNSVCSVNPSLDVYFNSTAIFFLIIYIGRFSGFYKVL